MFTQILAGCGVLWLILLVDFLWRLNRKDLRDAAINTFQDFLVIVMVLILVYLILK